MVSAYLQMAETSPNVYTFVTRYAPGGAGRTGSASGHGHCRGPRATSSRHQRHDRPPHAQPPGRRPGKEAVIGYWPNAAIGLVRNAGEQWLASPASAAKPDQAAMARQITDWLCFGIAPELWKRRSRTAERTLTCTEAVDLQH